MVNDFLKAITAYAKAFRLIGKLGLWGYFIIPGLISLLLGGVISASVWNLSDDVGGFLLAFYPWEWGASIVASVANVFGGIVMAGSGLLIYKHAVLILSAPFMSPLSEKVENYLSGNPHTMRFSIPQMMSDLVRGLKLALRNIVREFFFMFLLLLLGLIPFFSPFTAILLIAVQAYYLGFGNIDYTLERHFNVRGSVHFVRTYKGLALGNGLVVLGLLAVGIGFLIAPPLGTVAATIETVKRLDIRKDIEELV